MKNPEEFLDRFINTLNQEEAPVLEVVEDPELESLLETADALRLLREPEWPDTDFPTVLATRLARELSIQHPVQVTEDVKALRPAPADWPGLEPKRETSRQHDRAENRDERRWFRQGLELVAGVLFLALIAGIMVTVLESRNGTPAPGPSGLEPAVGVTKPPVTPVVVAPGKPVTLEEAEEQVRAFLGDPDAVLSGEASDRFNLIEGQSVRVGTDYIIKRQKDGVRYPDRFTVDGSTGEITEATLPSSTSDNMPKRPVSETEADLIATKFAQTHFDKFDQLTVHDEDHSGGTVGARGQDTVYQVRWQLRSPDSGAWLPTFVWVGVDLETGQVTRYFARRTDYRGPTAPKIDREQAVQIALAEAHKDPDLANATAGQVELSAGSVGGQDSVTWNVSLDNVPPHSLVRHFSVDAITGEILNPLGSPVG